VIAGQLRGRAISAPAGDATRPTGARVKEALFSILGDVSGARVLDLYAGSGALGIEALSRGASAAVFVEAARPALACLRENLTKLGLDSVATTLPCASRARRASSGAMRLSSWCSAIHPGGMCGRLANNSRRWQTQVCSPSAPESCSSTRPLTRHRR
jgi:hypothetical protein